MPQSQGPWILLAQAETEAGPFEHYAPGADIGEQPDAAPGQEPTPFTELDRRAGEVGIGQTTGPLETCKAHMEANRLTTPSGTNALECYRQVLKSDPGNSAAQSGLGEIVGRYIAWAESATRRGKFRSAENNLRKARRVDSNDQRIRQAQTSLDAARKRAARARGTESPKRARSRGGESSAWKTAYSCGSVGCYADYLDHYPNGRHAAEARRRVRIILGRRY